MKLQYIAILILILLLSGCADAVEFTDAATVPQVGFLYGLWHGMILPISFVVSLFSESTAVYAIYNNGGWYDLGFVIGVNLSFSSSSSSSGKKSK